MSHAPDAPVGNIISGRRYLLRVFCDAIKFLWGPNAVSINPHGEEAVYLIRNSEELVDAKFSIHRSQSLAAFTRGGRNWTIRPSDGRALELLGHKSSVKGGGRSRVETRSGTKEGRYDFVGCVVCPLNECRFGFRLFHTPVGMARESASASRVHG